MRTDVTLTWQGLILVIQWSGEPPFFLYHSTVAWVVEGSHPEDDVPSGPRAAPRVASPREPIGQVPHSIAGKITPRHDGAC
jgi:hypothetical protein